MRNFILSLAFLNIFILRLAVGQSIDNIKQDYFVSGVVYLDDNQNGIFDSLESGIGGVAIKYGENQTVRTDPRGRFEIQFQTKREFERLVIDPNTLPAGADFTSPPQLVLNRSRGLKRKVELGI